MEATELLQDCGDKMRETLLKSGKHDYAAVAKGLISKIKAIRTPPMQIALQSGGANPTAGISKRRAYIVDALRHPAEVHLLRRIYDDAFVLIGIACEEEIRQERLRAKFPDANSIQMSEFMKRDAKSDKKYGQKVADTFHLADYFLDNTVERLPRAGKSPKSWDVIERLGRLVKIITHAEVTRPSPEETAMHHAYAAKMQSACLSRQVGAALIDAGGALISTGTNEVPRAGGGVYGESTQITERSDGQSSYVEEARCAMRGKPSDRFCSNTREQNDLVEELVKAATDGKSASEQEKATLRIAFRSTRVGGLLEFSRAVHAEMDALLTAGRTGSSTIGTRLFVTTFPCHYCARHIVSAGVDEVQYIEPYPKSLARKLHDDSIEVVADRWIAPTRGGNSVLFRPFSGVSPQFYYRAFLKDRDLKNDHTGSYQVSDPEWGSPYYLSKLDYRQMEEEVTRDE